MSWKKLMSEKVPEGKTVLEVELQVNDETKERRFFFHCKEAAPPPNPKDEPEDKDWRGYETVPGAGF